MSQLLFLATRLTKEPFLDWFKWHSPSFESQRSDHQDICKFHDCAKFHNHQMTGKKSYPKSKLSDFLFLTTLILEWLRLRDTLLTAVMDQSLLTNNIHLLDKTETNIIFIWSGEVILGEAKLSLNITLPDQINMILGEVLSNKCFIIPAHVVCTRSIARFIDSGQEAIYQVACSAPLYKFAHCVIYFRT